MGNLRYPVAGSGNGLEFAMYNLVGREVFRSKVTSTHMSIGKNNLPAGLYIYILTGKETIAKGKLIIE